MSDSLLQPIDSNRVANALIAKIKETDLDVAEAVASALMKSLRDGLTCGLGDALVTVVEQEIRGALRSDALKDTVRKAIESGMDRMPAPHHPLFP